jgi:hypothetical protein
MFRHLRRACGAFALAFFLPAMTQAANFEVTSNSDLTDGADGDLTLREAITLANNSPDPDTINFAEDLSGKVITLTQGELAIADDLHIDASNLAHAPVIDADRKSRVMHFTAVEGDLELTKLTLRNGNVTLISIVNGGGGGILFVSSGALTLTDSTLSDNSVTNDGRFGAYGGGIRTKLGAITLTNSTVNGNSVTSDPSGPTPGAGGGIHTLSGAITIANSIIARNSDDGGAPDVRPPDAPANNLEISHSLIGNSTGARLDEAKINLNNLVDVDPQLASLADNGGDTQTMLPFPGSPVIDAGGQGALILDQRGFARLGAPDIGAVEYQGRSDLGRVFDVDNDGDGNPWGIEQALGTDPFVFDPKDARNLIAPTFNPEGQPVLGFGIAENAIPGTRWILERTTDLMTFEEIYRYDGVTHLGYDEIPIDIKITNTGVKITDQDAPTSVAFYRFRAVLVDPD